MDSLTQIVLGAAVGEAVLGRKVGNRAMLWGGIAGTIPDLDVFANLSTDPMSSLAYHRAFTHSIAFGVIAPFILSVAIHRLYGGKDGPTYNQPRWLEYLLGFVAFFLLLLVGSYLMPIEILNVPQIALTITVIVTAIIAFIGWREQWRKKPSQNGNATIAGWYWLFFGAIITHPLLDCFTAYGTQIFQPFDAHRATWNTISVADPIYTIPFLLLLVMAGRKLKGSAIRKRLNTAGLIVSSIYLGLTILNHFNVEAVMKDSITQQKVEASRFVIQPSIFNNILWQGTVQGQTDDYYFSKYSLLDRKREFEPFEQVDGQHDVLKNYQDTRELKILNWFTKGYIGYIPLDSGKVQVNDLRYGIIGDNANDPDQYIFHWVVDTTVSPVQIYQEAGPGEDADMGGLMNQLWQRLKGI